MGTSTDRTGEISIVIRGEEVTTDKKIGKGDGVGKSEVLGDRVCSGYQRVVCSVERRQEVHPGMTMFNGKVAGDERQEDRVVEEVREEELMMFDEWVWEERTGGRRQRDGVSYSPPGQTSHFSTPARLSRSLLRPSILSIGSGTCMPTGSHSSTRSS